MPARQLLLTAVPSFAIHRIPEKTKAPEGALFHGRSERIRTSGPCLPKTVLYQAELHSDCEAVDYTAAIGFARG